MNTLKPPKSGIGYWKPLKNECFDRFLMVCCPCVWIEDVGRPSTRSPNLSYEITRFNRSVPSYIRSYITTYISWIAPVTKESWCHHIFVVEPIAVSCEFHPEGYQARSFQEFGLPKARSRWYRFF